MDGIEKFAVFGRYWQPAQAHVDIHSQYVGDCGATAPESRRKSKKTRFDEVCGFSIFHHCPGIAVVRTDNASGQWASY